MESAHVREFVVLATKGHFRRAAHDLNVSQASLTRHIEALENEIGVKLFDRNRRGVSLTSAGTAFLPEARALLHLGERAVRLAQRVDQDADSYLRVGHLGTSHGLLRDALQAMARTRPILKLILSEYTVEAGLDQLSRGDIDLFITRPPVHDEAIDEIWLRDDPLVVALPAGHALSSQPEISLDQLSEENLIMPEAPGAYLAIRSICDRHGLTPQHVQVAADLPSLFILVSAGLGYGFLPESSARYHHDPNVHIATLKDDPVLKISLRAAWRRADRRPLLLDFRNTLLQAATVPGSTDPSPVAISQPGSDAPGRAA